MSGAKSRNKGCAGERELARILSDELGMEVTRNLLQSRSGGHDLDGIPGWCLEVKRRAKIADADKRTWWGQACESAKGTTMAPALLFRADRQEWRAIVELYRINSEMMPDSGYPDFLYTAEVSLESFCQLVRETLPDQKKVMAAG